MGHIFNELIWHAVDTSLGEIMVSECGKTDVVPLDSELPDGVYWYPMRHSDNDAGCPSTIELDPVLVNHWGILLSRTVLNFGPERYIALSEEDIAEIVTVVNEYDADDPMVHWDLGYFQECCKCGEIIRHSDPCVTFDWGYYRAFENADYPEGFISEMSIADPDYGRHLMCKQCYKDMVNE